MRDPHELADRLPRFKSDPMDEAWLLALNRALADAPLPEVRQDHASELPIVYIVGAPRSGTTLLSQVVSRCLRVGYINNLIARFWLKPSVGIRLSRMLMGDAARAEIGFESTHGSTAGLAGPHEFGYFWRRWLDLDAQPTHHLSADALAALDASGLRHALRREVLAAYESAAVFKNVICGFQAAWLAAQHPASLFVHITRDREPTAASVLQARRARFGSYSTWWSLKPSSYAALARIDDPPRQVVGQIDACRAEIDGELLRPGVRSLTVTYSRLCGDPRGVLDDLAGAVRAHFSYDLPIVAEAPSSFPESRGPELDPSLRAALRAALEDSSES